MSKKISLEQSLQAYRVMNTPTEYSWKQHFAKEHFSKQDAMELPEAEKEQFYKRLKECQITIANRITDLAGRPCTLKDLLDTVTDPANANIDKQYRKVVYSTSNGERPVGAKAFELWNGFQVIDLDIKDKCKAQWVKNQIFQKLRTCNWFMGVGFSASGKGLHVWTKINVPEEDDVAKRKLLYLTNFRHKFSYVYIAITSGIEAFGQFTKEDVQKWMDVSMCKPQQGAYIGYDEHPRINSDFFEDFIYVNFDNIQDIGHPDIDWVAHPDLKLMFKRWEWFEGDDGEKVDIQLKDFADDQLPDLNDNSGFPKVHYKHFERWRLANTLVGLFKEKYKDKDEKTRDALAEQAGYKYLRMICSNAIKDKELQADCSTAARHDKPIDPWAVNRLNSQHGFKIKLNVKDSFDGSDILSSAAAAGNPTLIKESPRCIDFHLTSEQYLGHIRQAILDNTERITLLEAGPGLGKTEMVKQLVTDGHKIIMVMPFTSVIKAKVEKDENWYYSYGNRAPRLDMAPGVAMTIDKFSYMNIMDIKTAGYEYIFIDESHLMFLSEYRPVMAKVVDLIKNSEVPIIMMSGTPCGELVFFPDATHIHITKDDNRKKEFVVNLVETPSDLIYHMCRKMAEDVALGRRILFPTNSGTLYSKQIEAAVNYFLRMDHQIFEPVNLKYYKKANVGEQFMDDVNFEKTIKDVQILLCSAYMSVGTDVLDRLHFSIYFADLMLPHEIDQFCNRLRKNDLFAHLYVARNDSEGNSRSLQKFKPLNFKLNDEEIKNVHAILRLCNNMIERNPVEYKYNSLISSIIYDNKFIEYNNIENKYFLNETTYKIIQFERKYREYAQQLPVVIAGMEAYGYKVDTHELGGFGLDDGMFANLKDMVKLAYDEGLEMNTAHITELMEQINENNLKAYRDILAGKYEVKKGDYWKIDISNRRVVVRNMEIFEKVIPIFISLSKQYEVPQIREIFKYCQNSGGTYNFAAIGRIRMLVNILYNDKNDRLDVPIKEFMEAAYKFSERETCSKADLDAFIKGRAMVYVGMASTAEIPIEKSENAMTMMIETLSKIFRCLVTVSRPKKNNKITMKRAELLWKERKLADTESSDDNIFILNDFLDVTREFQKDIMEESDNQVEETKEI